MAALTFPAVGRAGGPYVEVGVWNALGSRDAYGQPKAMHDSAMPTTASKVDGPYASVEVGYSFGRASVTWLHLSSVATGRDAGVNMIGVKYRIGGK